MPTGAFLDRASPPSEEAILAALGDAAPRWAELVSFIDTTYGVVGELLFGPGTTGWFVRFRRGGRALLSLAPEAGLFRALVVVGPTVEAAAMSAGVGERFAAALHDARAYPDGRWLFLSIDDAADVADVKRLVLAKSPPPRRVRRPAAAPAG